MKRRRRQITRAHTSQIASRLHSCMPRACNKFRDDLRASRPNPCLFIRPNNARKDRETHTQPSHPLALPRGDPDMI